MLDEICYLGMGDYGKPSFRQPINSLITPLSAATTRGCWVDLYGAVNGTYEFRIILDRAEY